MTVFSTLHITACVHDVLLDRLADCQTQFAVLVGRKSPECVAVAAYTWFHDNDNSIPFEIIGCSLPAGIDVIGIATGDASHLSRIRTSLGSAADANSDHFQAIIVSDSDISDWRVTSLCGSPLSSNVAISDTNPLCDTITLSATACEQIVIEMRDSSVATSLRENLTQSIEAIRCRLNNPQTVFFECEELQTMLQLGKTGKNKDSVTAATLLTSSLARKGHGAKLKTPDFRFNHFEFKTYHRITGSDKTGTLLDCAPVVLTALRNINYITIPLRLSGTCIVSSKTDGCDMSRLLHQSLLRSLDRVALTLKLFVTEVDEGGCELPTVQCATFLPEHLTHFVEGVHLAGIPDEISRSIRLQWHKAYGLPVDRPFFKPSSAYVFPDTCIERMIDVHVNCKLESAVKGAVSVVQGRYFYHHYMQDNIDDSGWGCAYRSLQTVWSWYRLQGYTDLHPPSHKEIQQALVDIGDRPAKFVGSRQWIGSLELSYVLNHLLQVDSRIVTAASGAEVADKARQLARHFESVGSPVMIGGGVLAHTILGVDFNEDSGEVRFLVLDPHYTGDEDIQTIVSKGWCGWKQSSFWQGDSFYNLLLPQRPSDVI